MKIFIAGLGLMGSAYGEKLNKKGHIIFGMDQHPLSNKTSFLEKNGIDYLKECDVLIMALPPQAMIQFIEDNLNQLSSLKLITDLSGLKVPLIDNIGSLLPNPDRYISHHPMTGYHTSGPHDAHQVIFMDKKVIIIEPAANKQALDILTTLLKELSFAPPIFMTAEDHDKAITYTSHLPHLLASALMLHTPSSMIEQTAGPSFIQLSRFALMAPSLWSELFFLNRENLNSAIEQIVLNLQSFQQALNNPEQIKTLITLAQQRNEDR
jgi:prephenate dehydrogenase